MNVTARIIAEAPHRHCDVRPTSRGGDWPYGVIIHLDEHGNLVYRGFHPGRGIVCSDTWYVRASAIADIKFLCGDLDNLLHAGGSYV